MSAEVDLLGQHPDGSLLVQEKQVIRPDLVNKQASIDNKMHGVQSIHFKLKFD